MQIEIHTHTTITTTPNMHTSLEKPISAACGIFLQGEYLFLLKANPHFHHMFCFLENKTR